MSEPLPAELRPEHGQPRSLAAAARIAGVADIRPGWDRVVLSGLVHDSRRIRPGDLYAALPGSNTHGAIHGGSAVAAGAVAILTDPEGGRILQALGPQVPVLIVPRPRAVLGPLAAWLYDQPGQALLLLGVTGTAGKTTTTYLLESGLRAAGHRTGLIGTVQTRIADQTVTSAFTTPEAPDLQALLALMRERGTTAVAMEVSSHALAYGRVAGTTFDVALFTNLSQDHLDFHGDMAEYFAAKALLFTTDYAGQGVVNIDDGYGRRLTEIATVPLVTYSASGAAGADWRADRVRLGPDGSTFEVTGPAGRAEVAIRLPGPFNVANALGAIASLVGADVSLDAAVAGVTEVTGTPGRMERVEAGQDFLAIVDYAHKPGSLEAVLGAVREVTKGRIIVVVGCGGDRDRGKRPIMGRIAAGAADVAVLTNDNPRSEDPLSIIAAMRSGAEQVPAGERAELIVEPDRAAAIALAVDRAAAGDAVVVAGKGHEQGQETAGVVRPFDDRAVLRAAIDAEAPA
ncbi:MAG TPA: UDP-N-acetylmuramoyl-L-alanyl-D-glutamate--2,6-diaminopimelate ligase [Actinomycetes bacterium]|nr:UDP-N-acetylmuramoyl-L-alanyl-D-glutamate--2,6-diaminopimelate ligase [Actinomycetes bacterium]